MEDFDSQESEEVIGNIEQPSTPVRSNLNNSFLNSEFNNISPSMYTPQGTRFCHPFLSNILSNFCKTFTSPDMFNKSREYPNRDINTLSPDIAGSLFPKDINTNIDYQYQSEDKLYERFQPFFDKKSAQFFAENNIKPSPECQESSGLELLYHVSSSESNNCENDLVSPVPFAFACQTPPSQYKWNRPIYQQQSRSRPSVLGRPSFISFEDCNYKKFIDQENLDIAQNPDVGNSLSLIDNLSFRQNYPIGSPTLSCLNKSAAYSSGIDSSKFKYFMRSSPSMKCNPLGLNELNLSPIGHNDTNKEMETDDESI